MATSESPVSSLDTNTDAPSTATPRRVPNRLRKIQKTSRPTRVKRAFHPFSRAPKRGLSVLFPARNTGSLHAPRPATRQSVLSLGSISAWNRISLISDADDTEAPKRLTLHDPDDAQLLSRRSSMSSAGSAEKSSNASSLHLRGTVSEVPGGLTQDAELEIAANEYGVIPPLATFAKPVPKLLLQESWTDFVDRLFQPEAGRLVTRRLSAMELASPKALKAPQDWMSANEDYTEEEWLELEEAVIEEAQIGRMISANQVKVICRNTSPSRNWPRRTHSLLGRTATASPLSINTVDVVTGTEIQHDTLPYQTYTPFSPWQKVQVSSDAEANDGESNSITESLKRGSWLVPPKDDAELHLPLEGPTSDSPTDSCRSSSSVPDSVLEEIATVLAPAHAAISRHSAAHRSTKLVVESARPTGTSRTGTTPTLIETNSTTKDAATGAMTRALTGASPRTPTRYLMSDSYPTLVTPRRAKAVEVKSASATALPTTTTTNSPATTTLAAVTTSANPTPLLGPAPSPLRAKYTPKTIARTKSRARLPKASAQKRNSVVDAENGVFTRRITLAKRATPSRFVMNDGGFPVMLTASAAAASGSKADLASDTDKGAGRSETVGAGVMPTVVVTRPSLEELERAESLLDEAERLLREGRYKEEVVKGSEERQKRLCEDIVALCDRMGI